MADREARIKFKAETSEFQSQVQAANATMSGLRSEMKLNEAQFQNSGDKADYLEQKAGLLESQIAANRDKQAALNAEIQVATSIYGADSREVANLEKQLNYTRAQEEQLKGQLSAVNAELGASESATGKLTSTIERQEAELSKLKDEYVEAVLAYGENSDEANELAGEISDLSRELGENRSTLESAERAADDLDETFDDAADSTENLGGKFDTLKVAAGNLLADGIRALANEATDLVKETIEVGKTFEDSMKKVQALSGATGDDLEMLKQTAQDLGAATVYSSSEAADALGYMALAGWDANQSADALGGVLNLAAAGNMDLAHASDMVTDYLSAFNMTAEQSGYFADLLAYAQAHANTTADGLGEAFKNCAANMNAAGQDVETTTALLAMMANQGLKGSEAGTALTAVMRDMTAKMQDGKIAIGDTTVEVMDANGNYRDMTAVLRDVEYAVDGMGDAERAMALQETFTSDSTKALNLLLNAGAGEASNFEAQLRSSGVTLSGLDAAMSESGMSLEDMRAAFEGAGVSSDAFDESLSYSMGTADGFMEALDECVDSGHSAAEVMDSLGYTLEDLQGAMDSSMGTAEDMAGVMTDTLNGDLQDLEGSIEVVQLSLYDKLEPALRSGTEALTALVDAVGWVVDHGEFFISVIAGMATGIGAYLAYTTALNVMKNGWMALEVVQKAAAAAQWLVNAAMEANPIGILIGAISALVAGIVVLWNTNEDFRNAVQPVWDAIQSAIGGVVDWFTSTALPLIQGFVDGVVSFFQGLWTAVEPVWTNVMGVVRSVVDWFTSTALPAIQAFIDSTVQFFQALWTAVQPVWEAIQGVVEAVVGFIVEFVATYLQSLFETWSTIFTAVWNVATTIWNGISNTISTVFNAVRTFVTSTLNTLSSVWSSIWNAVWTTASNIWNGIRNTVSTVINAVRNVVTSVMNAISSTWNAIWNAVWTTASNIWNGIRNTISSVINAVHSVVSGVLNAISSTWNAIWNAVSTTASNIWNGIRNTIGGAINAVHSTVSGVVNAISSTVGGVFEGIRSTASNIWNGIKDTIGGAINAAQSTVSDVVNGISSTVGGVFDGIRNTVSGIWNGIKDAICGPIDAARDAVGGAIDAIAGIVGGLRLELPRIALPHFNVSGGEFPWGIGGAGSPPSFSVDWYARGGILTSPTIFGFGSNGFMGGGEAGPEAVLPIQVLQDYIDAAFERNLGNIGLDRVVAAIERLDKGLGRKIADNAPDSYPGDRSFRAALRKAGVQV